MTKSVNKTKRSIKRIIYAAAVSCLGTLFTVFPAAAQVDLGLDYATATGLGTTDIRTTIARIISIFLGLLGIIAVCLILYAGFLWMTAAGNEERITKAKKTMIGAVIGLVIILSAYAIVRFIFGAITGTGGDGYTGDGGGGSGLGGGSGNVFQVQSTMPAGPGPASGGWPKNYGLTITFNDNVSPASVDSFKPIVKKCNPRLDNDGEPTGFVQADCADYEYNYTVAGGRITIRSKNADTYWDGDFWYYVEVKGNPTGTGDVLRDTRDPARGLTCLVPLPPVGQPPVNIWDTTSYASKLCKRAVAFNDLVDLTPPTVSIRDPQSPPKFCGTPLTIETRTDDDFMPARVDFSLAFPADETHTEAEIAAIQAAIKPQNYVDNGENFYNPLFTPPPEIDTALLTAGQSYVIRAVAQDPVPQTGPVAEKTFTINLPQCCAGECSPESECGKCSCVPGGDPACTGDNSCTEDEQCASGLCEETCHGGDDDGKSCTENSDCASPGLCQGYCVEFPIIWDVSPSDEAVPKAAGAGSPVTILGTGFGRTPGEVWFLGQKDGSGQYPNQKRAAPCAPGPEWWSYDEDTGEYTVSVIVPDGAEDGPVKVITANGGDMWDDTTDDVPPRRPRNYGTLIENFLVEGQPLKPGICFASPNRGPKTKPFKVVGVGFGATMDGGTVAMGSNGVNVDTWTEKEIAAVVPPIQEGIYQLAVTVGGVGGETTQNNVKFTVTPPPGEETPKITDIVPSAGPVDSFITIFGSGFGSGKGTVRFISKTIPAIGDRDEAIGVEPDNPACSDFWHKTYIVIKVPGKYKDGVTDVRREAYDVVVRTQAGKESPPADFTINNETLKPGVCAIYPASGPPGTRVTVSGGGFGSGPGSPRSGIAPSYTWSLPHNTVNFYTNDPDADTAYRPIGYDGSWNDRNVSTWVPGDRLVKSTWPKSGPVYVEADNVWSSNSVPFKVQDCNEAGGDAACEDGDVCCANGSCKTGGAEACLPQSRISAYGWMFSTEILPEMPVVVKCAQCGAGACGDVTGGFQSPTPQGTDGCRNALIAASFNQVMDAGSFVGSVDIEECSDAEFTGCVLVTDQFSTDFTDGRQVYFSPRTTYNPVDGVGRLKSGAYYRVTLKATAAGGIKDTVPPSGRYLDGDYDRKPGGNFTFSFKVREGDFDCEIAAVGVSPSKYNVDHKDAPKSVPPPPPAPGQPVQNPAGFKASPIAPNCNILSCQAGSYDVEWDLANNGTLGDYVLNKYDTAPPEACWQQVQANRETEPDQAVALQSTFTSLSGTAAPKIGTSDVTAKFLDPKVVSYAPNCKNACIDAMVYAVFNVPMDAATIANNFNILKCRNDSCNPPYLGTLNVTARVDDTVPAEMTNRKFYVEINENEGKLEPSTSYRVELNGAVEGGIKSLSGVALKGLNEPNLFVWQFRTKDTATPCAINKSVVVPAAVTVQYIGQRVGLGVQAFGAPDECDPNGQQLNAWRHDWLWNVVDPSTGVVRGFLPDPTLPESRVDTKTESVVGCSGKCLNVGSQNVKPQCGNGVIESSWEECDKVADAFPSWCDPATCRFNGTSATCGDGNLDPGENCESVGGIWPPGCEENSCISTGAVDGNSTCGDGLVGDGEACDDGNSAAGDGCSRNCLHEGTLQSCLAVESGQSCMNFCGNNLSEPGEDAGCDVASGSNAADAIIAAGCDPSTCLKTGTDACLTQSSDDCCGNGVLDTGEQCDEFDDTGKRPNWCSSRCLLAGSSFLYNPPSFCRDGSEAAQSLGEAARCEDSGIPADGKVDPFQVVQAGLPQAEDVSDGSATDLVKAYVSGMSDENKIGKAAVTLSCTCKNQGETDSEHQAYCYDLGQNAEPPLNLGCDRNGCCAPAPTITARYPAGNSEDVCRNTVIRATFDQSMDDNSIANSLQVFEAAAGPTCTGICSNDGFTSCTAATAATDCGDPEATCEPIKFCTNKPNQTCTADVDCGTGDGVTCSERSPVQFASADIGGGYSAKAGTRPSLWQRIFSFVKRLFAGQASAAPPPPGSTNYCHVPGTIAVSGKVATFYPSYSFKPSTWHRVLAKGSDTSAPILSKNWVPLKTSDSAYFRTGEDICKIESVSVDPPSHLFSMSEDLGNGTDGDLIDGDHVFTARAHPFTGGVEAEIGSTPDYSFIWNWQMQPEDADPEKTSELVVTPSSQVPLFSLNGFCEKALNGTFEFDNPAAIDCHLPVPDGGSAACGNMRCETGEDKASCVQDCAVSAGQLPNATVMVRRSPTPVFPRNGQRTVSVTANIFDRTGGFDQKTASSDVTIMLCNTPWPSRRTCGSVRASGLPWDSVTNFSSLTCSGSEPVWYPFYDPTTNISFYYCRDVKTGGAESSETLPQLNEEQVVKLNFPQIPGQDILNEYLFTYVKAGIDPKESWYNDALGLRTLKNSKHLGIKDWYKMKGFTGAPQTIEVDDYTALKDGRTIYVGAVNKSVTTLYTNVYTLTHTDGAAPETVAIYEQLQQNLNLNMNMVKEEYCLDAGGNQALDGDGKPVSCSSDRECRVDMREEICANESCSSMVSNPDFDKVFIAERSNWTCKNEKGKVVRDMQRWSDILTMRETLADARTAEGWPRLEAGTFLRARTNSSWPSWSNVLSAEVSASLPTDPLNAYMECKASGKSFDMSTCWDSAKKVYQCPAGSHVYEYQSIGGTDFRIINDFETKNNGACRDITNDWTCNNRAPAGSCTWNGDICAYRSSGYYHPCVAAPMPGYYCHYTPGPYGTCRYTPGEYYHCHYVPLGPSGNYCRNPVTYTWTDIPCSVAGTGAECGQCQSNNSMSWSGDNCIELLQGACTPDKGCRWLDGYGCQFADGGILQIGGINQTENNCKNDLVGEGGVCGDGLVQQSTGYTEQCEPTSPPDIASCTATQYCSLNKSRSCSGTDPCGDGEGSCIAIPGGSRSGTKERACRDNCTWADYGRCRVGFCGDGVKQAGEVCDDGDKAGGGHNGDYGYCWTDCLSFGPRCGDGVKQPSEGCDCGDSNGAYHKNGVPAPINVACSSSDNPLTANVPSCSWDCRTAGPRCGDGAINGPEECDGGMQESKGYCNDVAKSPCEQNSDCPGTSTCYKHVGVDPTCLQPEQRYQRYCGSNDPALPNSAACTWGDWNCTTPGTCGDGTKNTGEECDDGNPENTDACVSGHDFSVPPDGKNDCRNAVCGDGFVQAGVEQCDEGVNNGTPCTPSYGVACNYCTSSCKLGTISSAYCGDGKLQDAGSNPPGPEECDGDLGMTDWICKSTTVPDQNYGRQTGLAHCSKTTCKRFCIDENSVACNNAGSTGSGNYDRNRSAVANGDALPTAYTSAAAVANWKDGYCTDPERTPCISNTNCPSGYTCSLILNNQKTVLANSCDPDIDNDGVPNTADCAPEDPAIHPAWTTGGVNISAPADVCDGKDNDCNGLTDNSFNVSGRMLDATQQTVTGIAGAQVQLKCGGIQRATATTDSSGNYTLTFVDADGSCVANGIVVVGLNNSVACADPADAQTAAVTSGDYCASTVLPDVYTVPRPSAGGIYTIQWGQPPNDLDFHIKTSTGQHVYYGHKDDGELHLDRDITGGHGPETITVDAFTSGKKYRLYVKNYSQVLDWGGATNVALTRFRGYSTTCAITTKWLPTPASSNTKIWWDIATVQNGSFISTPNSLVSSEPGNP